MIHVLFVCLGNICRSPMAEAVFRKMIQEEGLTDKVTVDSAGTSSWEEGNATHSGTRRRLAQEGISVGGMYSRPLNKDDIKQATYIIGMDESNMRNIQKFTDGQAEGQTKKLLSLLAVMKISQTLTIQGILRQPILRFMQGVRPY